MKWIKIRVWDKQAKHMFYQQDMECPLDLWGPWHVPMLCIGYQDKHKYDIYEGDIVLCRALSTTEKVVVKDIRSIPVQITAWKTLYRGTCEVLGNIYEGKSKSVVGK